MPFQSLPVSGTTNVSLADELGHKFPSIKGEADGMEIGRSLVEKIKREAQLLGAYSSGERADMLAQVNHIEATLRALEKLQQEGLASPDTSKVLLLTVADMAQKFLSNHKKMWHEASDRALSEGC